jgi:signal transduction histidine kinase
MRDSTLELAAFARELRVIAEPRRAIPLRRRKLELTGFIARAASAFGERGQLTVEVARGGALIGRWDREHLETMLEELLSNALKYGGSRPIHLFVQVRSARVRVIVTNHARGVRSKHVIARFARGARRTQLEGYGVGLWLTRRFARAHGGDFALQCVPGETRAIIRLPFDEARGELTRFGVALRSAR